MRRSHPTTTNITHGFADFLFAGLTERQRKDIVTLLARASERGYRRGFQQGATIQRDRPGDLPADLHDWRYGHSTDKSPWGDCPHVEPAIKRLFCENPGLARLGFKE